MDTKLTIPIAIVAAGALIAGALFFTRGDAPAADPRSSGATETIELRPVSDEDHVLGNPRARVVIVEYSDTECPFCKRFHETMHRVIDAYGREGDVAWVYRHFPIDDLHKKARKEAEATECAAELGGNDAFWKYIDRLYEITPSNDALDAKKLPEIAAEVDLDVTKFTACLSSGRYAEKVENDYRDAVRALGRGTPHNVLLVRDPFDADTQDLIRTSMQEFPPRTLLLSPDNTKLVLTGALPFDFLKLIIESVLKSDS